MKVEQIRINAENMIKEQKALAAKGEDFAAGEILEAERMISVVYEAAKSLTQEERARIYEEYKKPGNNMQPVKDIKDKYGLTWSDMRLIARTCEPEETPQARYDKVHTRVVSLKFNKGTDADILSKLEGVGNVQGYIKSLIRNDIKK